jgi:hypothetical protein
MLTDTKFVRFYVKKPNGKLRPVGAPDKKSKIYLAGLAQLLGLFVDDQLRESQHGFRSNRGLHTAWIHLLSKV